MDNRYYNYGCPALMNDARFISNYVRSSTFDQFIRTSNNINTSNQYRHFLQDNAAEMINNIKAHQRNNFSCNVTGKCLPINKPNNEQPQIESKENEWYDDLLSDPEPQPAFVQYN